MKTKSTLLKTMPQKSLDKLVALSVGGDDYQKTIIKLIDNAYKELK